MSQEKPNSYPPKFRESSIKFAVESDQPVAQKARELGVNPNTLHGWINRYSKPGEFQSVASLTDGHFYEELKHLKRENACLKEERDILKKATGYFAQESR